MGPASRHRAGTGAEGCSRHPRATTTGRIVSMLRPPSRALESSLRCLPGGREAPLAREVPPSGHSTLARCRTEVSGLERVTLTPVYSQTRGRRNESDYDGLKAETLAACVGLRTRPGR